MPDPGMDDFYDNYGLTIDDLHRFDASVGRDSLINGILDDAAAQWRYHLRPGLKTEGNCRRRFLEIITGRNGMRVPTGAGMEELPTLARYLCMRVERRVRELDAADNCSLTNWQHAPVRSENQ